MVSLHFRFQQLVLLQMYLCRLGNGPSVTAYVQNLWSLNNKEKTDPTREKLERLTSLGAVCFSFSNLTFFTNGLVGACAVATTKRATAAAL